MNTKQQGDIGVAIAIAYYTRKGCGVSVPLTDNLRYDLVIDDGAKLNRVQVKCTRHQKGSALELALRTTGGNQSWNKTSKTISEDEVDLVFGYAITTDTMYEFPVKFIAGKASLRLGPKVAEYIVTLQ